MDPSTRRIAALCAELTNYERDRPDRVRFDLASMQALLARPGAPDLPPRLVQVGGSKGKGTTARYLAALARETQGWRTGVYSSPHAETVLERVCIDGEPVDEATLTAALEGVLDFAKVEGLTISFYEAMTAAALDCFARCGVELGVLEVGLGGRLDATTAVPVAMSVLTMVELEHTEILGDTIEAIAGEKVHILRPGKAGVTGVDGVALEVAERRAAAVDCALEVLGRDLVVEAAHEADVLQVALRAARGDRTTIAVPHAPAYEARAAALAWAALRRLDGVVDLPERVRIARPAAPCCFEVFDGSRFVLDGAHTPGSAELLRAELQRRFGDAPRALLFGCARGKRWREMLERLVPDCELVLLSPVEGTACEDPAAVRDWLRAQQLSKNATVDCVSGVDEGVARLREQRGLKICTGSFYLAGAARPLVRAAKPG